MLIIFVFFSVISTGLVGCLSIAVPNVVIKRECAYLIEDRINAIIEGCKGFCRAVGSKESADTIRFTPG
jgi:hypothetical protein